MGLLRPPLAIQAASYLRPSGPARRCNDKYPRDSQSERCVCDGEDPSRQVVKDQPVGPIADEIMRITASTGHFAQAILEYRQWTGNSSEPLRANHYDRQQMRDAEPGPTHPFPSASDSDQN